MKVTCAAVFAALAGVASARYCHCLPGESCWPSEAKWKQLNQTVHGRLVKVVPIGAVCHDPTYDEAKCTEVKNNWGEVSLHYGHTSSLMTQYPTGQTCDPFTPREVPCTLGNYQEYTVDAKETSDVIATLEFAKTNNIRFVIRNTGHDFWGRSIGFGGLAVRIFNFKSTKVIDWKDASYKGPALKMGAGVMGQEAQSFLEPYGYVMVSGYCGSVGPAGGYVQGAGHSPLSSHYGLAADQTLEYEVITAEGKLVKASKKENSDLFFALNGGGAGTWGVVISMTVRVYPMTKMGAANMFIDPRSMPADTFWALVDHFYSLIPQWTAAGAYITYAYGPTHFGFFPFSAYNKTSAEVQVMLKPALDYLAAKNISHFTAFDDSNTYMEHATKNFAKSMPMKEWPSGGRLVPKDLLGDPVRRGKLVKVMRTIVEAGALTSSTSMAPVDRTNNLVAAHPAWRKATTLIIMDWPWQQAMPEEMQKGVDTLKKLSPLLLEAVPNSGSYSNEADIFMKEWRGEMYGPNWDKLLQIKQKWDPKGIFYSAHTPGADKWSIDDKGKMCRASAQCEKKRTLRALKTRAD